MENGSLMEVESTAECSPWSILQYFWPAFSDYQYWRSSFGVLLSGRLRQVLLYKYYDTNAISINFSWEGSYEVL